MDVNFIPSANDISTAISSLIDAALEAERDTQEPRNYLGGSRCGEECSRKLGYEFFHVKPDKPFDGQTLRRFNRGHDCESRMARYLRLAGFQLSIEKSDGKQYGFYTARDPETGVARIAGHLDGVFVGGPDALPGIARRVLYPCLWENKGLNNEGVGKLRRDGLSKVYPVYYAQMQLYMAYMDLTANPGLFTAENCDDCTIYAELVPFDLHVAQTASDRGVRVVTAGSVDELPRIAREKSDFRCNFCSFQETCWSAPAMPMPAIDRMPLPYWLNQGAK